MHLALLHHTVSEAQTHHIYSCWWHVNSFSVMQCDFRVRVWSSIPASVSNKAEWFLAWSLWSDQLCKTLDPVLVEFFPLLITPTNQLNLYSLLLYNWETILWHHCLLAPKEWWFWNLSSVIPMHNVIELYSSSANTVQETTKLSHFESERKNCESRGKIPNSISGRNLPLICSGRNSCL